MIIIGLGNVGTKYTNNRHNAGFMILDRVADAAEAMFSQKDAFHAATVTVDDFILAKPDTFMNDSGLAAEVLIKQFGGPLAVIHDDIDIPLGEVKCSFARGSGDHNGVQSIIDRLGTNEFFRIRIGVRPIHEELLPRIAPPDGFEKFLLSDFLPMEMEKLNEGIGKAIEIVEALKTQSIGDIMNRYN